ncbi:polar amino acid transport system substrate-binding protein [Roseateles sp. YR242]|uniref:substrate-binding periplasmic protein n=1 Tax=Roseateles sp. YR242 TaxID=1855305 RepID=UPI0008BF527E|nr:transporter substrate-binding domain-containing protein [Roseateles sp. YR242]SEK77061.1 polar amino acid transport system substrate-binding protein [Roseateles sp. YR242]
MQQHRRHFLQLAAGQTLAVTGLAGAAQAAAGRPVSVVGTHFSRLFEAGAAAGDRTRPRGLAVDILDAILLPAGFAPTYELYPWLRAQAMIEHGPANILVGPYRTPERERRLRFSRQPFYEDSLVFYARQGEQALWRNDFATLRALQVGAVQGWVYGDRFDQARTRLKLTLVRDLATALRMLQLGRLDLIAANQRNSEPVIHELGLADHVQLCSPPFAHLRGHFAFNDHHGTPWQTLVDAGMQRLRANGELAQMAARHGVNLPDDRQA